MANPIEIRAFRISAVGFLIISVLGFVFALLAHSQAIMLDATFQSCRIRPSANTLNSRSL